MTNIPLAFLGCFLVLLGTILAGVSIHKRLSNTFDNVTLVVLVVGGILLILSLIGEIL